MAGSNPLEPDGDPFGPPAISTLVCCLHCGEEYDSYRIEWRIERTESGPRGFWCCPTPGCDGKGFGFDILPVDPDYQDEHGGWIHDDDPEDDDDLSLADEEDEGEPSDDEPLPW
jgi:hypothetical protein